MYVAMMCIVLVLIFEGSVVTIFYVCALICPINMIHNNNVLPIIIEPYFANNLFAYCIRQLGMGLRMH